MPYTKLRRQLWPFNRQVPLGAIITQKKGRELCAKPCWRAVGSHDTENHAQSPPGTPQQPNIADEDDDGQRCYDVGPRPKAVDCQQSFLTSQSASILQLFRPYGTDAIWLVDHKCLTALSFASSKHAQTAKHSRGS